MERVTEDADGADDLGIVDKDADADVDRGDNPGISTEGDIGSNGNSKPRHPKIVSFSINNITGHSYSIQLTIEIMKLVKNLLGLK